MPPECLLGAIGRASVGSRYALGFRRPRELTGGIHNVYRRRNAGPHSHHHLDHLLGAPRLTCHYGMAGGFRCAMRDLTATWHPPRSSAPRSIRRPGAGRATRRGGATSRTAQTVIPAPGPAGLSDAPLSSGGGERCGAGSFVSPHASDDSVGHVAFVCSAGVGAGNAIGGSWWV
jgi:hypothetical protein